MNKLIRQLHDYRLEHRLSQQRLAKILHVAFCTVNRWLKGRHEPNMLMEHQIQKLLKRKHRGDHE
jgi:transcriptional regulator with XRE-family HTH domain